MGNPGIWLEPRELERLSREAEALIAARARSDRKGARRAARQLAACVVAHRSRLDAEGGVPQAAVDIARRARRLLRERLGLPSLEPVPAAGPG